MLCWGKIMSIEFGLFFSFCNWPKVDYVAFISDKKLNLPYKVYNCSMLTKTIDVHDSVFTEQQ